MRRPLVVALLALVGLAAAQMPGMQREGKRRVPGVIELDGPRLQQMAGRHKRMVVWMHEPGCAVTKAWQPWLFALSNVLPRLALGKVDVTPFNRTVANAFGLAPGIGPALKALIRDNEKGERVVDYTGPLDFDSVLSWSQSILGGEDHEHSRFGVEPPEGPTPKKAKKAGGDPMSNLPKNVREMAETMVRESRLQKVLRDHGGGILEQYEGAVADTFNRLKQRDDFDADNKQMVQELNRAAREMVRNDLLASAPLDVREEIEAEVSLGDMPADSAKMAMS